MAEFKINGRMKVKTLKENFKKEFGGVLHVKNGNKLADDDATLASIRANDVAIGGELVCRASRTVGKFEQELWDTFGIRVNVFSPDDWVAVLDGITLSKINNIPKNATKADMESLVAYKRDTSIKFDENNNSKDSVDISLIPSQESFYGENLMDWLREVCIIETKDDVYFDAESADEDDIEMFINNIKAQNTEDENEKLEQLKFATPEDFIAYLEDEDQELLLAQKMVAAAYCTSQGIEIDEDTTLYVDEQLYYFNDCRDVHYEYSTDIDLG